MDKLTPQQRHKNMAAIHSKDTKPEMIVRRGLWARGFRYRLNHKRLPGTDKKEATLQENLCTHLVHIPNACIKKQNAAITLMGVPSVRHFMDALDGTTRGIIHALEGGIPFQSDGGAAGN